ncbi:alpha/beta fold hydrolase [Streptomyces sp. PT12]|uniref:alpha/beta fold hydrolase n=1 Tax=Streptomyces sp. PT12 TaxID=1510197 RepID=UPI000DE4F10A|nr:alpha/beta hydrolase [Streptomyces sp. PT12]RBM19624.1 hypothetical protein DEH69_10480 [Streptomyces sp. PT12]
MRLESMVGSALAGALTVSTFVAATRRQEEARRRRAPGGTSVLADRIGGEIEYVLSGPPPAGGCPVIVCENGLGSPLESWDWIVQELQEEFTLLRYHRRGYARTSSVHRPAALIESLLEGLFGSVPVLCFVSHSIGSLVTANVLHESPRLRQRTKAVFTIDGTDATLLETARNSPEGLGRYRQMSIQEGLASVTGLSWWTVNKMAIDVNYRARVQESYLVEASHPRTLFVAHREYLNEPLIGQEALASYEFDRHVIAAGDNVTQQRELAKRTAADFSFIEKSNHRSIIGKITFARTVARTVRDALK